MARLNLNRQKELEPERMNNAIKEICLLGYSVEVTPTSIKFDFKNHKVTFFPYSGWHTGKSIKDGRGLKNLLSQIK